MRRRPLVPRSAAARRDLLAEYAARYWRERRELGAKEALRACDALWRLVKRSYTSGSIAVDRKADLQMHILISAALARTAPNRTRADSKPTDGVARRVGSTERRGRLRNAR